MGSMLAIVVGTILLVVVAVGIRHVLGKDSSSFDVNDE